LVNTFKMSRTLFNIGLITALSMTILAFSWTTYDYEKPIVILESGDIDDVTIIERTIHKPPPPPPPPPPVIIPEVVEPDETPDDIEFVDPEIVEPELVVAPPSLPVIEKEKPKTPEQPLPDSREEPSIVEVPFTVVEDMPRFPGCEDVSDKNERKKCAQQKMLQYIYQEINYPTAAQEVGIEGMVVVRFYIDEEGNVKAPEILKEIGGGCGKEALRVVNTMNNLSEKWTPGRQRGRAVKVYFNLPVKYKLN